jgi:hypothetical protein
MGSGRGRADWPSSRGAKKWVLVVLVVLLAGGGAALALREPAPSPDSGLTAGAAGVGAATQRAAARRETRPTLDPARFVGKAAVTHQIARDIPDVLDELYCYCECDKSVGHRSLLSCYTDGHAAT